MLKPLPLEKALLEKPVYDSSTIQGVSDLFWQG
jgi:hypothetical protein